MGRTPASSMDKELELILKLIEQPANEEFPDELVLKVKEPDYSLSVLLTLEKMYGRSTLEVLDSFRRGLDAGLPQSVLDEWIYNYQVFMENDGPSYLLLELKKSGGK